MDRSDADQPNPQTPPVTEDSTRTDRPIALPACVNSGLASVISIFVIGLMSGAAGGLLLGAMAVVLLQCLADNKLITEGLGKHTRDSGLNETNSHLLDIQISILAETFGVFSTAVLLPVGIYIGLSTYSLVIKIKGEEAMGKALALAGPASLTGVTATGYILGLALQSFLSITLKAVLPCFIVALVVAEITFAINWYLESLVLKFLLAIALIASATFLTYLVSCWVKIRSFLALALTPMIVAPEILSVKKGSLKFITVPLSLMLIISDVYKSAGWQIVAIQSTTPANTSSTVLEAIFVGVLTSQMLTVAIGMSMFLYWQRGGAGKICAAAAGTGGAVLRVIESALPVLRPGPSIGALMGVAGAVGVSIAAAVALTDQYGQEINHCGFVGWLGVTVGAAVGAFLSSCAHSGLSGVFMGLCAATVPAGAVLMFLYSK